MWIEKLLRSLGLFRPTFEKVAPSDIVPETSIAVIGSTVVIDYAKTNIPFTKPPLISTPGLLDSDSMLAVFDFGHNNIMLRGADAKNQKIMVNFIKAGDIIIYTHPYMIGGYPVIHRVVEVGLDNEGRWFTLKGDHNDQADPVKIRDKHILTLYAGTIP